MDDLVESYRATYQRVVSGKPAARSRFDVHLGGRTLFHVKDPCVREDVKSLVFVRVVPEDPKDLTGWRRRRGFEYRHFLFPHTGLLFEGKCMAIVPLPDYPISGIRTGQQTRRPLSLFGRHRDWTVEIPASR